MVCTQCGETSLLGRTIQGRSTAGYDYRAINQYGEGQERSGLIYSANGVNQPKLGFDLGTLVVGVIIGGVLGYFIFAPSGRRIGSATAGRIERKIRG